MCDCIKNLEKKMVGRLHKNKKIIKAEFISRALIFDEGLASKSFSEIELTTEGAKRPVTQNVIHTYCPFCGVKYPDQK